jgi:hypothetical protein
MKTSDLYSSSKSNVSISSFKNAAKPIDVESFISLSLGRLSNSYILSIFSFLIGFFISGFSVVSSSIFLLFKDFSLLIYS